MYYHSRESSYSLYFFLQFIICRLVVLVRVVLVSTTGRLALTPSHTTSRFTPPAQEWTHSSGSLQTQVHQHRHTLTDSFSDLRSVLYPPYSDAKIKRLHYKLDNYFKFDNCLCSWLDIIQIAFIMVITNMWSLDKSVNNTK